MRRLVLLSCLALTAVAIGGRATAQCTNPWLPGSPLAGTNGSVFALEAWDPDGAGPQPPLVVAGGNFTAAGGVSCNRIAAYDPATQSWSSFGSGMNDSVQALAVLPNGDLVAAGMFTTAGGVAAARIARWNGSNWAPLGSGISGFSVAGLAVLPNGALVAAGNFSHAGGVWVEHVAQWNGATWAAFGAGLDDVATDVAALPNGDIVVGGQFTTAGGVAASRLARWNGTTWSPLGAGSAFGVVRVLAMPNGDVVAAGAFQTPGQLRVGRWNGATWTMLGPVTTGVQALAAMPNGDLVATAASTDIVRWNGAAWSVLGDTPAGFGASALALLPNGSLVAGGALRAVSGVVTESIAFWNGTNWSPPAPHAGRLAVTAVAALPGGDVVAGVEATLPSGATGYRVERWNGTSWSQLGPHFDAAISALLPRPNGELAATGAFTSIGGVAASGIASWNGASWQTLGAGLGGGGLALQNLPGGDLLVGGSFGATGAGNRVARWNGSSWSDYGAGLPTSNFTVRALAELPGGGAIAGTSAGVFRRVGASWTQLGTMGGNVTALGVLPNGHVVAAGQALFLFPARSVARWNGTTWAAIDGAAWSPSLPSIAGLAVLPDGDVVVSGAFFWATVGTAGIVRWNGSTWSSLATFASGFGPIATHPNGDLLVGGSTTDVDGIVADRLARLTTTCPATAIAAGSGCTGSGGPNVLAATALPWLGGTFAAVATGMPTNGIALDAIGFATTSIPLATILPQGAAGCSLLVTVDALGALLPANGSVRTALAIPTSVGLLGGVLHEQVLPLEFDANGNVTAFTATNRLTLTIGSF